MRPKIGFVGLGTMGAPMASHLANAGHDLLVWNRTPEKAAALSSNGVSVATTLEEMGGVCDLVFLCVNRTEDVRECVSKLTLDAKKGSLYVDHSTISPQGAVEIHKNLAGKGFRFVDAPITGGSVGAIRGQLTIFCGGDVADIEEAMPFMKAYAKKAERVGGPGTGQMMKMANQIAVGGALIALTESMSFAKKAGLDLAQTRDLLSGGAAGSWALENYGPKILADDHTPGFSVKNQRKDFSYCREAAEDLDAAIPATLLVDGLLAQLQDSGGEERATTSLYQAMLEMGFKP